jgi:hypothetical protein
MCCVDHKSARDPFIRQQPRFASGFARKDFVLSSELLHDVELTQNYTGGFLARKLHLALVSWAVIFLARQNLKEVFEKRPQASCIEIETTYTELSFPESMTRFYRILTKLVQY